MRTIRFKDYVDYKPFAPSGALGFSETTEAPTIPANTYSYNNNYWAFHLNDQSTGLKGCLSVPLGKVYMGDMVEITAEVMSVSGDKPMLALNMPIGGEIALLRGSKVGEFEPIGGKFVIPQDSELTLNIGLFTSSIGEYYIRNLEINIKERKTIVPDIRAYVFRLYNGLVNLMDTSHPYTCTTNVTSTYIEITHTDPFPINLNGHGVAVVSGSAVGYITAKCRTESKSSLRVQFFNSTTGATLDPTSMLNSDTYFSVIHHGYKVV